MARRRLQWRIAAAVAALAVVVSIVAIGLSIGGTSGAGQGSSAPSVADPATVAPTAIAPTTTVDPAPSAVDIAAARACEAFTVYLADAQKGSIPAAVGRTLIEDAGALLQGAQQDQAASRALPPWSALGADLLAAAEDVVSHKSSALRTDGAAAGALCRTVPAAAARAGGFNRTA